MTARTPGGAGELIEEARREHQICSGEVDCHDPVCVECAEGWPCLTSRLAAALEEATTEHRSCGTFLEDAQIQLSLAQEDFERAQARAERLAGELAEIRQAYAALVALTGQGVLP